MSGGAQISLYPMTGDFIPVILNSVKALDPYREYFPKIETDDLSTVLMGPAEYILPAIRDLFVAAAATGVHVVTHATISRGCPGMPGYTQCEIPSSSSSSASTRKEDLDEIVRKARSAVEAAPELGQHASAQFAYYPLGGDAGSKGVKSDEGSSSSGNKHMDEIYACIDFIKASGVFKKEKNFVTKLSGDSGKVFATLHEVFLRFGKEGAHVALDLTVSANSPSLKQKQ